MSCEVPFNEIGQWCGKAHSTTNVLKLSWHFFLGSNLKTDSSQCTSSSCLLDFKLSVQQKLARYCLWCLLSYCRVTSGVPQGSVSAPSWLMTNLWRKYSPTNTWWFTFLLTYPGATTFLIYAQELKSKWAYFITASTVTRSLTHWKLSSHHSWGLY